MALLTIPHWARLAARFAAKPVNTRPPHIFLNEFVRITLGLRMNLNIISEFSQIPDKMTRLILVNKIIWNSGNSRKSGISDGSY